MRLALMLLATLCLTADCQALYIRFETEKVPVERILANLQTKLKHQPDSFDLHYQLARAHAMAAFTESGEVTVYKSNNPPGAVQYTEGGGDNGTPLEWGFRQEANGGLKGKEVGMNLSCALTHYQTAIGLLRKTEDHAKIRSEISKVHLGYAWCLEKAGVKRLALERYRETFCIAWSLEVSRSFDVQAWKDGARLNLKDLEPTTRSQIDPGHLGPGICLSEEAISYMLRILDKEKDAAEISVLNQHKRTLEKMGRSVTPILIPLSDAPFETLVDPSAQISFDLDGSGLKRHWGWITPKAAWLVFDGKQSGQITSGLQMFGSVTFWIFWRDGYQALGSLDANGDDKLTGGELIGLALWHDADGDGVSDPGEVRPIAEHGIDQLSCRGEAAGPGLRLNRHGVRFKDGTFRASYDWDAPMNAPAAAK
jgi:hypothetical protein